jgi:hypothetical protein
MARVESATFPASVPTVEPVPCPAGDNCLGHPALPEGWTSWQEALHRDDNFATWSTWHRTEPLVRAESLGHQVEWDPPAALTTGRRWTCKTCGEAVLIYHNNIYGGAMERTCQESLELRRERRG